MRLILICLHIHLVIICIPIIALSYDTYTRRKGRKMAKVKQDKIYWKNNVILEYNLKLIFTCKHAPLPYKRANRIYNSCKCVIKFTNYHTFHLNERCMKVIVPLHWTSVTVWLRIKRSPVWIQACTSTILKMN